MPAIIDERFAVLQCPMTRLPTSDTELAAEIRRDADPSVSAGFTGISLLILNQIDRAQSTFLVYFGPRRR